MTVAELIEKLREMPQGAPVVVSANSDYADPDSPAVRRMVNHGGWWSDDYRATNPLARDVVVIE